MVERFVWRVVFEFPQAVSDAPFQLYRMCESDVLLKNEAHFANCQHGIFSYKAAKPVDVNLTYNIKHHDVMMMSCSHHQIFFMMRSIHCPFACKKLCMFEALSCNMSVAIGPGELQARGLRKT